MGARLATAEAGCTACVRTTMDSLGFSEDEPSVQNPETDSVSFGLSSSLRDDVLWRRMYF